MMFPNLNAELSRHDVKTKDFAARIGVSEKTANNKLSGRTEFTLSEIRAIGKLFPDCSLDYLFATA